MTTAAPARRKTGQPVLTYLDRTFVWQGAFKYKDIAKNAGFRWSPEHKYWWTREWDIAARLQPYADDTCSDRLLDLYLLTNRTAAAIAASRATNADIDLPTPPGLEYMPFQRAGIAFAIERLAMLDEAGAAGGVLIADEPGLGKTIQAAGVINYLTAHGVEMPHILVVCPASLKINWRRELEKWLVKARWVTIAGEYFPQGASVRIVNYDRLRKFRDALRATEWDMVIADEAHMLKTETAQRSQEFYALRARRKLLLTGTPIVNRPMELWPLARCVAPDVFSDRDEYERKYYSASFSPHLPRSVRVLKGLQDDLRSSCMVRRLKKDVLKELPAKQRQVVELAPGSAASALREEMAEMAEMMVRQFNLRLAVELAKAEPDEAAYKAAVDELRDAMAEGFGQISRLRHQTALAKVPEVVRFVRDAFEGGESKLVLFAHHQDVIAAYVEAFKSVAVRLVGGMANADRQRSVDLFQKDPAVKLFVGSIQAAGMGLTLTAASHVIFAELGWTPAEMTQAEDRAHRIGQTQSVLVQHLVFEDSLDATMANKLVAKQRVIDLALDSEKGELSDAPLVPMQEDHATAGVSRQRIQGEAARFEPAQVQAVRQALALLQPANPMDRAMVEALQSGPLTTGQAALGRRIARKYTADVPAQIMEVMG